MFTKKILKQLFVEPLKMVLFRATTNKVLEFIVFDSLAIVFGIWLFPNRIPTSEKVACKPSLDYFLECFLLSTFTQIISVLSKKISNKSKTWGYCSPAPGLYSCGYPNHFVHNAMFYNQISSCNHFKEAG